MREPENFYVETLDMKNPNWKSFDFTKFDVIFHVAGIAHVNQKQKLKDLYFKINRDLAVETALKAKESGVKQFIFMSSMIVYNSKETIITRETKPNPDNFYGQSKLDAENILEDMQNSNFKISILRPPMIYGLGSKGNFPKLISFARKTLIFPKYDNKRSALYINNLTYYIKMLIDQEESGLFFPRNKETLNPFSIVNQVASIDNRFVWFTKIFNPFISFLKRRSRIINKIFGDFYYEIDDHIDLQPLIDTKSSIKEVVGQTYGKK